MVDFDGLGQSEHADRAGADDSPGATPEPPTIADLYRRHALHLIRLATMLLGDRQAAEDVVQDAFAAMHRRLPKLREPDRVIGYLRSSVINGARSTWRHRSVAMRHRPEPPAEVPSAEQYALDRLRDDAVRMAVARLPRRQREVILLRYLEDLSIVETAATLRISAGAVTSSTGRAMTNLAAILETNYEH